MDFLVSVIVPVYNGEAFIKKAITSICQQPEVGEIIVINDGCTDKTQEILDELIMEYPIIKVYFHENKSNKGRSASRNLGIVRSTGEFIAFLDADDFYLKNRFKNDKKIFEENYECDGVYNAIGAHFYRETNSTEKRNLELTTITKEIEPEFLFDALLSGRYGHFSIDGLTVKRSVFEQVGYFNEDLSVSEDTELFYRLSLKCKLMGGIIDKPVAMRGVHNNNVFNRKELYSFQEIKMYEILYVWTSKEKFDLKTIERFLERIWIIRFQNNKSIMKNIFHWIVLVWKNPSTLFTYLTIKYFPLLRFRFFYVL